MTSDHRYPHLREHFQNQRGEMLSAALTILRAYILAGKPSQQLAPWGSFEQWSGLIREAVVFAGLSDPGETRLQPQTTADRDGNAFVWAYHRAYQTGTPDGISRYRLALFGSLEDVKK